MSSVLVIGMADSIHIARWLEQFDNTSTKIYFLPSRKFRKYNSELKDVLSKDNNIRLVSFYKWLSFAGYIDFLIFEVGANILKRNLRVNLVTWILRKYSFEIIHSIELQSAGYLLLMVTDKLNVKADLILTNWGSDIYFYQNEKVHRDKIKDLLGKIDFYSAECFRDYELAKELGFKGAGLPIIPNAGGFRIDSKKLEKASQRNVILVKGTGGKFGNAELLLPIFHEVLRKYANSIIVFYSVTSDMVASISRLQSIFPQRVKYFLIENKISHEEMLALFEQSRIYVSSSKSDGISTSFLEALISGAFPIQSNTSCANEWLNKGFMGLSIPNSTQDFQIALHEVLESDDLVDRAQQINRQLAHQYLDVKSISNVARKFYDRDFLNSIRPSNVGAKP